MRYFYQTPIPGRSQPTEQAQLGTQLATNGALGGGNASVKALSAEATDLQLVGQLRWGESISEKLATELDELSNSSLTGLALYDPARDWEREGYYVIDQADIEPLHPNSRGVWQYDIRFTREGGTGSHLLGVSTSLNSELQNDFGTAEEPYVGIDARAPSSTVRWFDENDTKTTEPATPVETIASEFGDVELYDPAAAPYADPTLTYQRDLQHAGDVDVVVWDTRGNASKTDADGVVQWVRGYNSGRRFSGALVFSNRIVRVTIDDEAGTITAERTGYGGDGYGEDGYGTSDGWRDITLGTSDWQPVDVDLVDFGPAVAQLQVLFENTSSGELYALDARLYRGWDNVLWTRPTNETDPTPAGLQTLLEPIASPRYEIPTPTATLVDRSGVRK